MPGDDLVHQLLSSRGVFSAPTDANSRRRSGGSSATSQRSISASSRTIKIVKRRGSRPRRMTTLSTSSSAFSTMAYTASGTIIAERSPWRYACSTSSSAVRIASEYPPSSYCAHARAWSAANQLPAPTTASSLAASLCTRISSKSPREYALIAERNAAFPRSSSDSLAERIATSARRSSRSTVGASGFEGTSATMCRHQAVRASSVSNSSENGRRMRAFARRQRDRHRLLVVLPAPGRVLDVGEQERPCPPRLFCHGLRLFH